MSYANYNNKTQPKAKSQKQKPKAKSQKQIKDFSSKMQQKACKSEILVPNWKTINNQKKQ